METQKNKAALEYKYFARLNSNGAKKLAAAIRDKKNRGAADIYDDSMYLNYLKEIRKQQVLGEIVDNSENSDDSIDYSIKSEIRSMKDLYEDYSYVNQIEKVLGKVISLRYEMAKNLKEFNSAESRLETKCTNEWNNLFNELFNDNTLTIYNILNMFNYNSQVLKVRLIILEYVEAILTDILVSEKSKLAVLSDDFASDLVVENIADSYSKETEEKELQEYAKLTTKPKRRSRIPKRKKLRCYSER